MCKRTAKRLGPLISDMLSRQISTLRNPSRFVLVKEDVKGTLKLSVRRDFLLFNCWDWPHSN